MNTPKRLTLQLAGLIFAASVVSAPLIIAGCGGAATSSSQPARTASVTVGVQWPKPGSRVIPINTQFVWFEIKSTAPTTPDAYNPATANSATVTQSSASGTIVVSPGTYSLVAEAFPVTPTNPQVGDTAATAWQVMPITVQPGANAFSVTLGSTVDEFDLSYTDSSGAAQLLKVSTGSSGSVSVPFNGELTGLSVSPTFNGTPLLVSTNPETFTASASASSPDISVTNAASGSAKTTISLGRYLPTAYGKTEILSLAYNDGTGSSQTSASATISFQNETMSAPSVAAGPTLPAPPGGSAYLGATVSSGAGATASYAAVLSDGQALVPNASGVPGLSGTQNLRTCGILPLDPNPYLFSDLAGNLTAFQNLGVSITDPIGPSGSSAEVADIDSGTVLYNLGFQLMLAGLAETVVDGTVTGVGATGATGLTTADPGAKLSNRAGTDPFVYSPAASAVFDGTPAKAVPFASGSGLPTKVAAVKGVSFTGSAADWKRFFLVLDAGGNLDLCAELVPPGATSPVVRLLTTLNASFLGGTPAGISFDPTGNLWFLVNVGSGATWHLEQVTFG